MLSNFKNQKNFIKGMEANVQAPETSYMSAKEALKLASQKWVALPIEKIFEEIQNAASKGYRNAHLTGVCINGEQLLTLQQLGYKVDIYENSSSNPFFIVSW